jgi:hypothetical protein
MNLGPLFLFAGPCFTPFERERRRHESKKTWPLCLHTPDERKQAPRAGDGPDLYQTPRLLTIIGAFPQQHHIKGPKFADPWKQL